MYPRLLRRVIRLSRGIGLSNDSIKELEHHPHAGCRCRNSRYKTWDLLLNSLPTFAGFCFSKKHNRQLYVVLFWKVYIYHLYT